MPWLFPIAASSGLKRGLASTRIADHRAPGQLATGPYLLFMKSLKVLPLAAPRSMKTQRGTVLVLGFQAGSLATHWQGICAAFVAETSPNMARVRLPRSTLALYSAANFSAVVTFCATALP